MRRKLHLILALVLGLVIFSGCEMANNPMEVEQTYNGSKELTKNSTDQVYELSVEIINENSQGNLVFRFKHEGSPLKVNSIKINETTLGVVSYNCIEPRSITQVIVDPLETLIASALVIKIEMELEGTPITLTAEDRTYDYEVWNQPIEALSVSYTKIIDDNGNLVLGAFWMPEVDDEVLVWMPEVDDEVLVSGQYH